MLAVATRTPEAGTLPPVALPSRPGAGTAPAAAPAAVSALSQADDLAGARRKPRLPEWSFLVAALIVVGGAAIGVMAVRHRAESHRVAASALGRIEAQAGREATLKRQALVEHRVALDLIGEVRDARRRASVALDELGRLETAPDPLLRLAPLSLGDAAARQIAPALEAHQAAVDEVLGQLVAGRYEQARASDQKDAGPRFETLRAALDRALAASGEGADRASRSANLGFTLTLLLTASVVGGLSLRSVRMRQATDRITAEQRALRASEEGFRSLVQHAADIITVLEVNCTIRHVSPAVESILGYAPDRLVGTNGWALVHPSEVAKAQDFHAELLEHPGAPRSIELRWQHRDGVWRYLEVKGTSLLHHPEVRGIVLNARDITEHKALEQQLTHRALHDQLTSLPNRMLFMDRLEQALARSARRNKYVAVLFLDLDRFKLVNDSFGHDRGDQLLVEVGERLRSCLRRVDTIARLGGDEFTVLLEDVGSAGDAVLVAERITDALKAPFLLEGQEIFIGASIGVALGTWGQGAAHEILRNADVAMYRAKSNGRARFEVFKASMREPVRGRLKIEAELRHALERGELRVHYQPQVQIGTGRIVGLEALVRWQHPQHGMVPPGQFIPLAEETGLILPLGRWVLQTACQQASLWRKRSSGEPLVMAVNLSPQQFRHPRLAEDVARVLNESGLDPAGLEVEITESTAMGDADATITTLERLKAIGVRLAIDDFGTGYSSLGYLRRFPLDVLKVDRSFVGGLPDNKGDAAIVQAVIGLARAMGLKVVAEGVETAAQLAELRDLGCDLGQGYYFGKPNSTEATEALLEKAVLP